MKNTFLLIASIVISLLIAEVAHFGYYYVTKIEGIKNANSFYGKMQSDDQIGYKLKPNLDNYNYHSAIVNNKVFTDAEGFRNVGRDYATAELAYFGDSFVEPSGINDEDSFHRIIESKTKVGAVSFAVSGWGLAHYSKALEVYLPKLPKVNEVVIVLFANDFSRKDPNHTNSVFWEKYWTHIKTPTAYEVYLEHNLFKTLMSVYEQAKNITEPAVPFCEQKYIEINGARLWSTKRIKIDEKALKVTGQFILDDLALLKSKRPDVTLSIVLLPSQEYIWNELIAEKCPSNARQIVEAVTFGHKYISDLGKANGFNVYDASPAIMSNFKLGKHLFIHNDGHLNENGHKVLAEYLEDKF